METLKNSCVSRLRSGGRRSGLGPALAQCTVRGRDRRSWVVGSGAREVESAFKAKPWLFQGVRILLLPSSADPGNAWVGSAVTHELGIWPRRSRIPEVGGVYLMAGGRDPCLRAFSGRELAPSAKSARIVLYIPDRKFRTADGAAYDAADSRYARYYRKLPGLTRASERALRRRVKAALLHELRHHVYGTLKREAASGGEARPAWKKVKHAIGLLAPNTDPLTRRYVWPRQLPDEYYAVLAEYRPRDPGVRKIDGLLTRFMKERWLASGRKVLGARAEAKPSRPPVR